MKLKENISIDEFDGKRYQIRIVEPDNNGKAVLTHYLHNIHNGVSKYYKEDALKALDEYILYKQEEENISIVAEDAMQQLLFEVENVPFPSAVNFILLNYKFVA
jgi:DNA (cytosine-5)-methyltransferase 1